MMKPECFFETAELLKEYENEAHLRSSISRSFYAVFHSFLNHVCQYLSREPKNNPHKFIANCLQNCSDRQIKKVGSRFDSLCQRRRDADYRLDRTISKSDSEDVLVEAQKVIKDYNAALEQDAEMQEAVIESIRTQGKFQGLI
jgi:uncharacterized protein (UPF0332 family)